MEGTKGSTESGKDLLSNSSFLQVSGGFEDLVLPVADLLNIPHHRVFANVLFFDKDGKYKTFEKTLPTSESGGKRVVCRELKKRLVSY